MLELLTWNRSRRRFVIDEEEGEENQLKPSQFDYNLINKVKTIETNTNNCEHLRDLIDETNKQNLNTIKS